VTEMAGDVVVNYDASWAITRHKLYFVIGCAKAIHKHKKAI
jgi:hypothetical protein